MAMDEFFPRCYSLNDETHLQEFLDDFKSLAAKRLLTEFVMRCEGKTLGGFDGADDQGHGRAHAGSGECVVVNKAVFEAVLSVCAKRVAEMDSTGSASNAGSMVT
jgi:hypothetical protein